MKALFFIIVFLVALILGANAQSISGTVYEETGQPLDYVPVALLNAADSSMVSSSVTENGGQFRFDGLAAGTYLVKALYLGYDDYVSGPLRPGAEVLSIRLVPASTALEQVTVTYKKPLIEMQADKIVVNVESSPVASNGTAIEALRRSPGVMVDKDGNISMSGKQGVQIMIDGRLLQLSAEEVARMLKSMPANSIEKIEIIQNPSAKYDAAGNAGIINIKLKKGKKLGFNGSAYLGGGYGRLPKANSGLMLNYRESGLNLFANYDYGYGQWFNDFSIDRAVRTDSLVTFFNQKNKERNTSQDHNVKLGADWQFNDRNVLGVLVNGAFGGSNGATATENLLSGNGNDLPYARIAAGNTARDNWSRWAANLNYQHTFDTLGRTLSFDADHSRFRSHSDMDYTNAFFDQNGGAVLPNYFLSSLNDVRVDIWAGKTDLVLPIKGWNFETGLKSSLVKTDNGIDFRHTVNDEWVADSSRSNQFIYEENINAGYLNLSRQLGKVSLQAGLRAEHTASDGFSVTLGQRVRRDYLNFFPSASLSWMPNDTHSLSLSYSYRIDRPSYQDLNPFVYYLDQYTFGQGNPFLRPQYTHTVSVNYGIMQAIFLTLNYSRTTNAMTEIIEQDPVTKVSYQTTDNLDDFSNYSFNLSAPFPITKWWMNVLNFSGNFSQYSSAVTAGNVDISRFTYNIYAAQSFTLPKDFSLEVSGWYNSPSLWGLFTVDPMWTLDFGAKKSFLDGNLILELTVNDIFFTQRPRVQANYTGLDLNFEARNDSRRVHLKCTYRFGNAQVRAARERRTGIEEEQGRVKGK